MSDQAPIRTTSVNLLVGAAIASVLLFLLPGGIYGGALLAVLVLAAVLASPVHRRDLRMVAVGSIATVATLGALLLVTLG